MLKIDLGLDGRGERGTLRDVVEEAREARAPGAPIPDLVPPREVFERGAENDLRRVERAAIGAGGERRLEAVGDPVRPRFFEGDDPGCALAEAQFAVPHGDGVEKG